MTIQKSELDRLLETWRDAGLDARLLSPIVKALKRDAEIVAEMRALEARAADVRALALRVAEGAMTIAEAIDEHARGSAHAQRVSAASSMTRGYLVVRESRQAVLALARRALREDAGRLSGALEGAFGEIVEEVSSLAPIVEGVGNATEAAAAGAKVGKAWGRLHELEPRRRAIAGAWGVLRRLKVLDTAPEGLGVRVFAMVRGQVEEAVA